MTARVALITVVRTVVPDAQSVRIGVALVKAIRIAVIKY